jgi:hypothetical protein
MMLSPQSDPSRASGFYSALGCSGLLNRIPRLGWCTFQIAAGVDDREDLDTEPQGRRGVPRSAQVGYSKATGRLVSIESGPS